MQVCATLLAASLHPPATSAAAHPNGVHMNGHAAAHDDARERPALLAALKDNIDPSSAREVSNDILEASLEAVGRLGAGAGGAELLLAENSGIAADVATLALGRTGASYFFFVTFLPPTTVCQPSARYSPAWTAQALLEAC